MENLGYRLKPLWEEDIIIGALEDMERAGMQHQKQNDLEAEAFGFHQPLGNKNGKAVQRDGSQVTPAYTPMIENIRGTRDISMETKRAFSEGLQQDFGSMADLQLPDKRAGEPFVEYEAPLMIIDPRGGVMCSLGADSGGEPLSGFLN